MKLKSYFAASVEAAMNQAAQELGPDAMLVHSRRTTAETRHLGEYEVVFAATPRTGAGFEKPAQSAPGPHDASAQIVSPFGAARRTAVASVERRSQGTNDRNTRPEPEPETATASESKDATGVNAPGASQVRIDRLSQEVGDLRKWVERLVGALHGGPMPAETRDLPGPQWTGLLSLLTAAGVDAGLAQDIVTRLDAQQAPADGESLAEELKSLLTVDAALGRQGAERRVVAVVGPPGSGKTTTLVKLAARYGLACRRTAHILSMDVYRIAAAEQLRFCAAILGIGFQAIETSVALGQALEEHINKDLILIDTPGFGRRDTEDALDLAEILSAHPEIDTHLVLSASMRAADLTRAVDQFEVFQPAKLLFTRIDETDCFGPILNEVVR
ncbi:MAG: flagellar biosynthesis protein FlhF, partial [Bryobacteraceae bacterium]